METNKCIGLVGIIISAGLLFLEINFQDSFSRPIFITLMVITLFLGVLSWQYTISDNLKTSLLPTAKITLVLVIVSGFLALIKTI